MRIIKIISFIIVLCVVIVLMAIRSTYLSSRNETTTSIIVGIVVDSSGAPIRGASVKYQKWSRMVGKETATTGRHVVTTNELGLFVVTDTLSESEVSEAPFRFEVTASANGYWDKTRTVSCSGLNRFTLVKRSE